MSYIPQRGDAVWLTLDPTEGHEQAGRRPVLVLTPQPYNEKTGLMIVVPITNRKKGYPFEVEIPDGLQVSGVILSDHVKSADWQARRADYIDTVPGAVVTDVLNRLNTLIG
ncbi:MAG: endoribonuclease MazF [Chloroflexota bacterium]